MNCKTVKNRESDKEKDKGRQAKTMHDNEQSLTRQAWNKG